MAAIVVVVAATSTSVALDRNAMLALQRYWFVKLRDGARTKTKKLVSHAAGNALGINSLIARSWLVSSDVLGNDVVEPL